MANKKNKKSGLTGHDVLIAVLISGACSFGVFLIALGIGGFITTRPQESQTVEAPSAQAPLPFRALESMPTPAPTDPPEEPSSDPTPEQTAEPVQQTSKPAAPPSQAPQTHPPQTQAPAVPTQAPVQTRAPTPTPAPTRAPTVPVQTPAPVVTVPPAQNTPNPAQSGNQNQGASANQTGRTVYITPTGSKYHYDNNCNGGTYIPSTLEEALSLNLGPCRRCVLN